MAINMEELLRAFGRPNVVEVGRVPQPPATLPQPARAPVMAQAPMQAPQAAQQPRGLLGGFFGPEGRDARSRLAIGLEGLAMNPNQALIGQLQQGIETRATAAQKNATIEWLRSRQHDDLAAALEAGAPVQEVLAESMRRMQPAAQPEPTALMQNVQWLMSQGIPMDRAIEMTRGGTTVNVGGEGQPTPQLLGTSGLVAIPDPSIPQGYRVEPAPGSPLALEAENARREAARVEEKAATGAERKEIYKSEVVRAAEKAKELMSKKGVTDILPEAGVFGSMLARSPIPLPGSQEATDLKVTLEAVQSGVAFDRLQAMRDASVTGGALGAVTERELALLMNSLGAISQEASPELLRENLDNIIRIMTKIENDPVAGRAYNTGQVGSGTTGAQIPQNGPVRITNDAEYEALPSGTAFISPDGKLRRKP